MKRLLKLENIFLIILLLIFVVETILLKSITNKIVIILIFCLILYTLFKRGLAIKDIPAVILIIIYTGIFILTKNGINNDSIIYDLFIFSEIFSFPLILYILKYIDKRNNKKLLLAISILLAFLYIIQSIIKCSYIPSTIVIIFVLISRYYLKNINKHIYIIFDIIILLTCLFFSKEIILLCVLIINYFIDLIKSKHNIIFLIMLIISVGTLALIINYTPNTEKQNIKYGVNNTFEFPTKDNSELDEIVLLIKDSNLKEKIFGIPYQELKSNTIMNNSIIFIYLYMGAFGLTVYLIIMLYVLKEILIKSNGLNLDKMLIILYSMLSPVLITPFLYLCLAIFFTQDVYVSEPNKSRKKDVFLLILLCFIIVIICYFMPTLFKKDYSSRVVINISQNESLTNKDLNLIEFKQITENDIIENLYYYELKKNNEPYAYITYVVRKMDEGIIRFITIENKEENLQLEIKVANNNLNTIEEFQKYNIKREYSTLVGYDKLELPIGYYEDELNNTYIIGQTFHYNLLVSEYDKENKSTIYDLIKQENDLEKNSKLIDMQPNTYADTYIISSEEELFEDDKSIEEYIDLTNKNSSWYTFYGNNYKLQYSIDPFTREGYGKMLNKLLEEDFYQISMENDSNIFAMISKSAIFSLYNHTAQSNLDGGIWLTNYTSTWLSKDYGIKAYYIDTRYNETIGYFLLNLYEVTENDKYLKSFLIYADFIVELWETESYTVNNNKILPDYFSANHSINTHSSFNHQLALINYLFKAYELINDEKYYSTSKEMLNGLLGFNDDWIRENGDIWYQVNYKGEFSGNDYPIVTLDDMLYTFEYLYKFDEEINTQLAKLISSKMKYLQDNNITIPESTQNLINKFKTIQNDNK